MRGVTEKLLFDKSLDSVFQLTRLMRGVTCGFCQEFLGEKFQLTRLMRGVTNGYII